MRGDEGEKGEEIMERREEKGKGREGKSIVGKGKKIS